MVEAGFYQPQTRQRRSGVCGVGAHFGKCRLQLKECVPHHFRQTQAGFKRRMRKPAFHIDAELNARKPALVLRTGRDKVIDCGAPFALELFRVFASEQGPGIEVEVRSCVHEKKIRANKGRIKRPETRPGNADVLPQV